MRETCHEFRRQGIHRGVRSSRRLEAETHRNIEVMWLLRSLKPDFRTIADFRRDSRAAFRSVFPECVLLCGRLDLYGRELLAVGGTRRRRRPRCKISSARPTREQIGN